MNTHSVDNTPVNGDAQQTSAVVGSDVHVLAPPPAPTDFIGIISTMLSEAGHKRPSAWTRLIHSDAHDLNIPDDLRRFLVNRVLRMALADAPVTTLDIRYCLVDKGDVNAYLALIKSEVVPCMTEYDLPVEKS